MEKLNFITLISLKFATRTFFPPCLPVFIQINVLLSSYSFLPYFHTYPVLLLACSECFPCGPCSLQIALVFLFSRHCFLVVNNSHLTI